MFIVQRDEAFILAELFAAVEEGNLSELEDLFSEPGVDPNMSNKVRRIAPEA